jgi:hypothetical protein
MSENRSRGQSEAVNFEYMRLINHECRQLLGVRKYDGCS